ncbi:MAG TPA: ribonuclease HII, partial [Candidatus Acidoferrales bacterium]|nr:ribonuclease HII [Candidatus Acidoferrales bacterium]
LDDSKKLTHDRREELAQRIREHALAWAVAEIDASRIDAWNIYQASRQAMLAAVGNIRPAADYLLIDAMELPLPVEQKALIHGDARSISIAAASILAKVERDHLMDDFDQLYPQYGLAQNRGYSTPDHLEALKRYGPTPLHRFSYAPVRESTCWAANATQEPLPLAEIPAGIASATSAAAAASPSTTGPPVTIAPVLD